MLPSGREVNVLGQEHWIGDEVCVLVDLDDVIGVVIDPDLNLGLVDVGIHWRDDFCPVGTRPYNCEASIVFDADDPDSKFAIIPAPAGRHGADCCPGCDEEKTAFRTRVRPAEMERLIDWLSGLPRGQASSLGVGLMLWRGARTPDGRAAVEWVTDDLLASEDRSSFPVHGTSTVSVVDLGLEGARP